VSSPTVAPARHRTPLPLFAAVASAAVALGGLALPAAANATVHPDAPVVISEVYGGGGNSGAVYDRDFIELYNASSGPVDLTGWTVQYASTGGSTWQTTALTGVTLAAGQFLVVGEAFGANLALPDVPADVNGTIPMSGTGGKVALVQSTAALTGSAGQALLPQVVDYVGWGAATDFAGSGPAPGTANATSVARSISNINTADNAADFDDGAPTPGQPSTRPDPDVDPDPDPEPVPLTIAEIQGTGAASPHLDTLAVTRGVVTASYPTGGFDGFVIQTPGTGGAIDLATHTASEALFVFAENMAEPAIGSHVEVTGEVREFFGLTEIAATAVTVLTDPVVAPQPAALSWPATDAQRETLESMLVQPQGTYTVSNTFNTNRFGEVGLAFGDDPLRQPTDVALPGSPEAAAVTADNAARAVTLDDGATIEFTRIVGGVFVNGDLTPPYISLPEPAVVDTTVSFQQPVIVDWRNNAWKFNPTSQVVGDGSGVDPVLFAPYRPAAPDNVGGDVSVASFNVLNYFTTLGTENAACRPFRDRVGDGVTVDTGCDQRGAWDHADLARQQEKIVSAINGLDASVVGLMEIENSAKLGEQPDEATATLVSALNAAAGFAKWAYVPSSTELPPVALMDVITNAIIYQPAEVTRVGASRALGTESQDDQAFGNAREPLAQVFRPADGGERFLFVVNHFKSKGSPGPWPDDTDQLDGQGAGNVSRTMQAEALRDWVAEIQGDVDSVVLAGDFNSYGQEDPLRVLYAAGYEDAEHAFNLDESSYSFSGLSGSLDHILLSGDALDRATGADIWNINSGEAIALEYSRYNYHGTLFHAPDPYRSSDHDPVLVGLTAKSSETTVAVPSSERKAGSAKSVPVNVKVTSGGNKVRTGSVEILLDGEVVATVSVNGGGNAHADLDLSHLAPGQYEIVARFTGIDGIGKSASDPVVFTVTG
jgi:5'-nucleotidase